MFHVACTRFTSETYNENQKYRQKHNIPVIYGSSLRIRNIYEIGSYMCVFEMNINTNTIEGMGVIKNREMLDRSHRIYSISDFNRYIYSGNKWISREQLNAFNPLIVEVFENVLFKKKSHLKCRIGITVVTDKLFRHWPEFDFNRVKQLLIKCVHHYYPKCLLVML